MGFVRCIVALLIAFLAFLLGLRTIFDSLHALALPQYDRYKITYKATYIFLDIASFFLCYWLFRMAKKLWDK